MFLLEKRDKILCREFEITLVQCLFLCQAIVNYNCRELVRAVPFFYDAHPDFVSAIITKLDFEVYLEGDVIIREGELGTEMYFLKSGTVSVSCDGVTTDDLTDGSYFGGTKKCSFRREIDSILNSLLTLFSGGQVRQRRESLGTRLC